MSKETIGQLKKELEKLEKSRESLTLEKLSEKEENHIKTFTEKLTTLKQEEEEELSKYNKIDQVLRDLEYNLTALSRVEDSKGKYKLAYYNEKELAVVDYGKFRSDTLKAIEGVKKNHEKCKNDLKKNGKYLELQNKIQALQEKMAKDDTFQKSKEIALYNREKISEFLRKEQSLKDKIEKHEMK